MEHRDRGIIIRWPRGWDIIWNWLHVPGKRSLPAHRRSTRRDSRVSIAPIHSRIHCNPNWYLLVRMDKFSIHALACVHCSPGTFWLWLRPGIHQRAGVFSRRIHDLRNQCPGRQHYLSIRVWSRISSFHQRKGILTRTFAHDLTDAGGKYMYRGLGDHWASSVPAFLALACVPFPLLFYHHGKRIRARCPYAAQAAVSLREMAETV